MCYGELVVEEERGGGDQTIGGTRMVAHELQGLNQGEGI